MSFFAVFLCIGITVFRDCGISWDEGTQRHTGIINCLYVSKEEQRLLTDSERYHGPAFEMRLFQWELTKLI